MYKNVFDLLLFYNLFFIAILVYNKKYRNINHVIVCFNDFVTCSYCHFASIKSHQPSILDFEYCYINV